MTALGVVLLSCRQLPVRNRHFSTATLDERWLAALNQLRNEINALYGYRDGAPRINLGPCGPFAKAFREEWNDRFRHQTHIAFVMSPDGSFCHHVLIRLPDGSLFDGGNGVISERALLMVYPGSRIDDMIDYDLKLLDHWSYGLSRQFPLCPNYSEARTKQLIHNCLESLPNF